MEYLGLRDAIEFALRALILRQPKELALSEARINRHLTAISLSGEEKNACCVFSSMEACLRTVACLQKALNPKSTTQGEGVSVWDKVEKGIISIRNGSSALCEDIKSSKSPAKILSKVSVYVQTGLLFTVLGLQSMAQALPKKKDATKKKKLILSAAGEDEAGKWERGLETFKQNFKACVDEVTKDLETIAQRMGKLGSVDTKIISEIEVLNSAEHAQLLNLVVSARERSLRVGGRGLETRLKEAIKVLAMLPITN